MYGTIIVDHDPASAPDGLAHDATIRNVTVFADAEVDRSPCGSGTSALLAQAGTRGTLPVGGTLRNASLTGAIFEGHTTGRPASGTRRPGRRASPARPT